MLEESIKVSLLQIELNHRFVRTLRIARVLVRKKQSCVLCVCVCTRGPGDRDDCNDASHAAATHVPIKDESKSLSAPRTQAHTSSVTDFFVEYMHISLSNQHIGESRK